MQIECVWRVVATRLSVCVLEQQLPVQLENVLQVAAEYAPHELVTYGLPGHSHQPITHGRLRAIQPNIRMVQ